MSKVYMMVTITNRNKRKDFRTFFKEYGLPVFLETIGRGTAQSEVLDYFGLEESEKLLFLAIVTGETWKKLRRGLITKMLIDVPGTGVSFIVPLSSVGGRKTLQFLVNEQKFEKEEETAMKDTDYELLVAIANQGYIDTVMDAARVSKSRRRDCDPCKRNRDGTCKKVSRGVTGGRKRSHSDRNEEQREESDHESNHGAGRSRQQRTYDCVLAAGDQCCGDTDAGGRYSG